MTLKSKVAQVAADLTSALGVPMTDRAFLELVRERVAQAGGELLLDEVVVVNGAWLMLAEFRDGQEVVKLIIGYQENKQVGEAMTDENYIREYGEDALRPVLALFKLWRDARAMAGQMQGTTTRQ